MMKKPPDDSPISYPVDEATEKIMEILEHAGAALNCIGCSGNSFRVVGGFLVHPLLPEPGGTTAAEGAVGTVVLVCDRCGYVMQHAIAGHDQDFQQETSS